MSQLQSQKYNIAWFKLAEFVTRKEKERALAIYKLLIHSLPSDGAVAAQLEGDLLLAFHDERALTCYNKAAELYEKNGNLIKTAAVYEHCATLIGKTTFEYRERLIEIYKQLGDNLRMFKNIATLVKTLASSNKLDQAQNIITYYQTLINKIQLAELQQILVCEYLIHTPGPHKHIDQALVLPLETALTIYSNNSENNDKLALNSFLLKLSELDDTTHKYACEYLKNKY